MNDREIKRYLNDLDAGRVTRKRKADAETHAGRISDWLQTSAGRQFLFGKPAAAALRKAKAQWREDAEAAAHAFANQCGGLPDDKQVLLVRLFEEFAYRGFSAIAAELRAGPRESGVTFAEEGRETIAKTRGPEIKERQQWVRDNYDRIRDHFPTGNRGDRQARAELINKYRKAYGPTLDDRMVRRDLKATSG